MRSDFRGIALKAKIAAERGVFRVADVDMIRQSLIVNGTGQGRAQKAHALTLGVHHDHILVEMTFLFT